MNWISSQSEQELRISMNKLGEEDMGIHEAGSWRNNSVLRLTSCASVSSSVLSTLLDLSCCWNRSNSQAGTIAQ